MIFDSLTHVTPDGRWFDTDRDASEDRLLREMDTEGVERAVVVALAGHISNEFVLEVCQRHSDRLVAGASFNPAACSSPVDAAAAFRDAVQPGAFGVLKLHPRLNRYDPLDPRCLAVLDELATWKAPLPVWLDSLLYYRGGELRRPLVDTLHYLVGRFDNIRFVILHAGGAWVLPLADAIRDCPNAYLDLSFTLHRYAGSSVFEDLRHLVRTFDRRLVYGSDFPEVAMRDARMDFRRLAKGTPAEKQQNVLGGNLAALLSRE